MHVNFLLSCSVSRRFIIIIMFSVSGVIVRSSSEFSKLVKLKSSDLHTEIIIREDITDISRLLRLWKGLEGGGVNY